MNTWVYLILITFLALLAAGMLYSRFLTRREEKSYHHSPATILFSEEMISAAPKIEVEELKIADESPDISDEVLKLEPMSDPGASAEDKGKGESFAGNYIDELQEAAAGLAALMRSSPVSRSAPVIFAPEESQDEVPSVVEVHEVTRDLVADHEEEEVSEVFSLREFLGDSFSEVLDQIDSELDALDELVGVIVKNFFALRSAEDHEAGSANAGGEIFEAA